MVAVVAVGWAGRIGRNGRNRAGGSPGSCGYAQLALCIALSLRKGLGGNDGPDQWQRICIV